MQSRNDGTWIDNVGETDDWLEVINGGDTSVDLSTIWLTDSSGRAAALGSGDLLPGQLAVVWVDDDVEQGCDHLPFKLDGDGERLTLQDRWGRELDQLTLPPLERNEVFARFAEDELTWKRCRYATPGRSNPESCQPPAPAEPPESVRFEAYELPKDQFEPNSPLQLSALGLNPSEGREPYIELINRGRESIDLSAMEVWLSPQAPGEPWPSVGAGQRIVELKSEFLGAQEHRRWAVSRQTLAELAMGNEFEGVATLFHSNTNVALDRIDFMSWPQGAVLARVNEAKWRLCRKRREADEFTAWAESCDVLAERPVANRLRRELTSGDFAALANGSTRLGIRSVKFLHELQSPGMVHLLSAAAWPLHYTFAREELYGAAPADRCDPDQDAQFVLGWSLFSDREYRATRGRTVLMGTLSQHGGAGLNAVEFTFGDRITGAQMHTAFLAGVSHAFEPFAWSLRPQDASQVERVRQLEGQLPLVAPEAPFRGLTYQVLSEGVGYGTLRFVPGSELVQARLGADVIVLTDSVPNDIPLVGGLLTESFQTPLAHVNVLSQSRGTPNASLLGASEHFSEYLNQLVRFEVSENGIEINLADPQQARSHWDRLLPEREHFTPRIDLSVSGPQALEDHGLEALPALGAKAAQLAELGSARAPNCGRNMGFLTPDRAFAIPVVHFVEHATASGALEAVAQLASENVAPMAPDNGEVLREIRQLILSHPVEPSLLAEVQVQVQQRFGSERVRFRSSSNAEDLGEFSGAGLYDSQSAQYGDPNRSIENAMRAVWASLYNERAYEERRLAALNESAVAMGILVHAAFRNERANGVAISRNLLDPIRGDQYFIDVQAGEASVTNPAPGVDTEQLVYRLDRTPALLPQSTSSLLPALSAGSTSVLTLREVQALGCALRFVHGRFRPLLDPQGVNPWFAMEVEFKFLGESRQLLLKQARPHNFGRKPQFADCREF